MDPGDIPPAAGSKDGRRAVSRESGDYLRKLRKNTPFGTKGFDLAALRSGMGTRRDPTLTDVKLSKVKVGDVHCEWVLAPGADPDLRLLYLHGGGFVSGSGGFYLPLAAHLSAAAGCAVLLPDYRLAPEHRFPAGLEDCIRAHEWLLANGPAGPAPARATFVAGDSAGGSLTLATLLALRDRRRLLPAGGIALSPTTDLTLASESLRTVDDPILSAKTMPVFRDHYLGNGGDPRNPLASPVFGDYRGLPPLLIQAGEHEMLRDDSVRMAKKARSDGAAVRLEVWPGMFHVFQSHDPLLPEAREAIDHVADFMRTAWAGVAHARFVPGPKAGVSHARPQPVLIRNDHNPLVQVVFEAPREGGRLKAVRFSLAGCDDVADLTALTLFATGDRDTFSPASPVGKPLPAARTITFPCDLALKPGKNVFWLSGQVSPRADLSHRVAAACAAIETTAGNALPKNLSPNVRQRIGVALRKHEDDGVHTYRIPALATTPKGTLLCVYDMRRRMGRDLQEDIDIGLSRSTDGGVTWEPARVIMDMGKYGGLPEEQNGCSDPGILVDPKTGEVFVFAVWMHGKPGKHQWTADGSEPGYEVGKAAQILLVRSKDDGRTWGNPENLTRKLKKEAWWLFAPSPQQGITLADGTLLMPAQGRDEKGAEFSTVMTSRDHGQTWAVGTPAYKGGSECQAVQLGDGTVMLNMRNDLDRYRAVFVTADLGKTWTPHETNRKALIEPNCNGSLIRVAYSEAGTRKHALLFANPRSQKARTHQTIQVSLDDGRTWPARYHLLLDEGRGAGYPSLTRIDDRHVGIVYEGSRAHLVFERIPLAELLDPARRK